MENLIHNLSFSEEEHRQLYYRLWDLVKAEAQRALGDDSTSMSVEKAEELMESLAFTLGTVLKEGVTREELLNNPLCHYVEIGRERLITRTGEAKKALIKLQGSLPAVQNVYFTDTCANLGSFFQKYDIDSRAHEVPVCIDYWPLCPVPESLKGVDYAAEYIRRLQMESDFLNCFEKEKVLRLYQHLYPSYEEDFFNLCEPVLECAVLEILAGREITALAVTEEDRKKILSVLRASSAEEMETAEKNAVRMVCSGTGTEEYAAYFSGGISGFLQRMLLSGLLSPVYPTG